MYISLCTIVVRNTAQNSYDSLHSYSPDSHHSSDVVYWRGGALYVSLLFVGYDGQLESESLLLSDGRVGNGTVTGMFKATSADVSDGFGNFIQMLI